jgi:hypothetical protein
VPSPRQARARATDNNKKTECRDGSDGRRSPGTSRVKAALVEWRFTTRRGRMAQRYLPTCFLCVRQKNCSECVTMTEPDAEQPISRDPELQFCGQACLAFGLVCKHGGMKAARFI